MQGILVVEAASAAVLLEVLAGLWGEGPEVAGRWEYHPVLLGQPASSTWEREQPRDTHMGGVIVFGLSVLVIIRPEGRRKGFEERLFDGVAERHGG